MPLIYTTVFTPPSFCVFSLVNLSTHDINNVNTMNTNQKTQSHTSQNLPDLLEQNTISSQSCAIVEDYKTYSTHTYTHTDKIVFFL